MRSASDTAVSRTDGWSAEPLTRALELLAEHGECVIEPRVAWEAAAEGLADGREDMLRSLGLAARRAGLRLGACPLAWPCEPIVLAELDGPAATWLPGSEAWGLGGRWVVLHRRGRRPLELAILDASGERRIRGTPKQIAAWLDAQPIDGEAPRWVQIERLLPLDAIASGAGQSPFGAVRRLLTLAGLEREALGVALVYALAIGAMSLAVPVAVQALVNSVAFGSVLQPLVVLSLLLAAVMTFVAVLRALEIVVVEAIQRRLFVRTAVDFARRLPRLTGAARLEFHAPELANRFFDVVGLQKAGAKLVLDGLALVLQMAVGMLLLAFYHPILLAFDLALLAALAVVMFVFGRGAVRSSLRESNRKYAVAAWLEDVAGSPLRFSSAAGRAFVDARAELLGREWLQARAEHFSRILRQLCGGLGLQVVASTALLGIGGALVIQRQLTLGQLVAAELVVTTIGVGLGKLGRQLEAWYDALASAAKLGKVVDIPLERCGGELLRGSGPVELAVRERGASLPGLALPPGAKLGLRGSSVAHALLLDRLLGHAPADDLDVRIDDQPLAGLDLESLRTAAILVRGVELVGGTLLDNLGPIHEPAAAPSWTIAGDGATLREILELVGLRERIEALPEGLRARVLPSGAPLRACEARRLMLARALLARPRLLLIDGGLDGLGLGPDARARLLDRIFAADAPWTAIVVSDDPAVLERCGEQAELAL